MHDSLRSYGWSRFFEQELAALRDPELKPGRVVASQRGILKLQTAEGIRSARVAGSHLHGTRDAVELPVVGDWVAVESPDAEGPARVRALLARRTRLSRKAAGERTVEQLVAANIDLVVIVMGLDGDYNLRRLERFLAMIDESGALPAVLLNKLDLCSDLEARLAETRSLASPAPVVAASALDGPLESVEPLLTPRKTAALVGSSGTGKTTLINRFLDGGELPTRPVRAHDSRGRHTTTHRELFRLPGGALIIDNPGIREIQPWSTQTALPRVFAEIEELAGSCRFSDCAHDSEPGCAVQQAIADGVLRPERLEHWHRLEREAAALERRKKVHEWRERDKRLGKLYKAIQREKRSRRA